MSRGFVVKGGKGVKTFDVTIVNDLKQDIWPSFFAPVNGGQTLQGFRIKAKEQDTYAVPEFCGVYIYALDKSTRYYRASPTESVQQRYNPVFDSTGNGGIMLSLLDACTLTITG